MNTEVKHDWPVRPECIDTDIPILRSSNDNCIKNNNKLEEPASCMSLGDRMKSYEYTDTIPPYQAFIVRADGKCFSRFTSSFPKPFDDGFQHAMVNTANNVMNYFSAKTVFCCSDEITLIFPAVCTKDEYDNLSANNSKNLPCHSYAGKKTKLESLIASKCAVSFNKFMLKELNDNNLKYNFNAQTKINECDAIFDARLIPIPIGKEIEIVNNLIWRSCYDCYRNTISTYGRHILGSKACNNKNGKEMIQMMYDKGFDFVNAVPVSYKYGVYGKKLLIRTQIPLMMNSKCIKTDAKTNELKSKDSVLEDKEAKSECEIIEVFRNTNYNFCVNLLDGSINADKALELFIAKNFTDEHIKTELYQLS